MFGDQELPHLGGGGTKAKEKGSQIIPRLDVTTISPFSVIPPTSFIQFYPPFQAGPLSPFSERQSFHLSQPKLSLSRALLSAGALFLF